MSSSKQSIFDILNRGSSETVRYARKKHLKKVTIVAATSIAARSEREAIVLGSVCVEFFKFNGNETSTLCRSMERTKPRAH